VEHVDGCARVTEPGRPITRPIGVDDQERRRRGGGDQAAEQFLRGAIDPMQVFQQNCHFRDAAALAQEIDQQPVGAQADQHAIES
jgi:hypothetical protein